VKLHLRGRVAWEFSSLELRAKKFFIMPYDFIEIAAATDAGCLRQFNEDRILIDPEIGVAIVADGMGGHHAGEVASEMATQIIMSGLRAQVSEFRSVDTQHLPLRAVEHSINRANKAIFDAAQDRPDHQGMGTTLAMTLFYDNRVVLGHVGDSRVYRHRNDALHLLTRDDSLLRDQIELGFISLASAGESHNRSLVTRALGIEATVSAHLLVDEAWPDDIYVLCSDGLHDLVQDADIALIVGALKSNLPLAASHLVQTAKDHGGYDNVSVILVKVRRPFPAAIHQRWFSRLLGWFR
jgi:serine/threonine protein phosphatase PrpC